MSANTILLIEDEPEIRDMLSFSLGRAGFQVWESPTAEDAAPDTPLFFAIREDHLGITEHLLLPGSRFLGFSDFCCAEPNPVRIGRLLAVARQAGASSAVEEHLRVARLRSWSDLGELHGPGQAAALPH